MVSRTVQIDGLLDKVSELTRNRDEALDHLLAFFRDHEDMEEDPNLTALGLALL